MNNRYKKFFKESSWSRILNHIQDGSSFAVISAYRTDQSSQQNKESHEKLRTAIRQLGYGYIEQRSGYSYQNTDTMVEEESFFIPKISEQEALMLCNEFGQESILFKDGKGFWLILKDGTRTMEFKTEVDEISGQITFNPEILKYAYSQLKKGSQTKKYAFQIKECSYIEEYKIPARHEAYQAIKTGILPKAEYIKII